MNMNEFLIEAQETLDAAIVEDGLGSEPLCMYHLGRLHGLLIKFIETEKTQEPSEGSSTK